jgi:hypothetical protein
LNKENDSIGTSSNERDFNSTMHINRMFDGTHDHVSLFFYLIHLHIPEFKKKLKSHLINFDILH